MNLFKAQQELYKLILRDKKLQHVLLTISFKGYERYVVAVEESHDSVEPPAHIKLFTAAYFSGSDS